MRFPWLQVDADFISAHAGDLGAHLGISRREAMGLALDLWTWALARAPDNAPPDGMVTGTGTVPDRLLAGSVGWTGPAEEFSAALVAVGLAVSIDGGYRLTGFDRYKATWEKNRRRTVRKPEGNRTGTGEEPTRKTQTHTQNTETPSVSASSSPTPAQGALVTLPVAQKPTTAAAEFAEWARQETRKHLAPDAPDNCTLDKHQWPRLGKALKEQGTAKMQAAFRLWMGWKGAQDAGYPLGLFVSKWEGWAGRVTARGGRAASDIDPGKFTPGGEDLSHQM